MSVNIKPLEDRIVVKSSEAEQTTAFQQLGAIKGKRFGAVDGSLWTSTGGPQAALQVIDDVERLLTKPDADPLPH